MQNIYCVIVTYNGAKWIQSCLQSLRDSTCSVSVIVVDNQSSDETVAIIRQHFTEVRVINAGRNLGFGQANNHGIKMALAEGADAVLLLNQDAWVQPQTIATLAGALEREREYGILSPLHLDGTGTALDSHFFTYFNQSHVRGWIESTLLHQPAPAVVSTSFVNAACWLLSSHCLLKVGPFDPFYFHYGEDMNFCQRTIFHGYKIGIHTSCSIHHDRAERLALKQPASARRQREWIYMANVLGDVGLRQAKMRYLKVFGRQVLKGALAAMTLQVSEAGDHFSIAGRMFLSASGLRQSRQFARRATF